MKITGLFSVFFLLLECCVAQKYALDFQWVREDQSNWICNEQILSGTMIMDARVNPITGKIAIYSYEVTVQWVYVKAPDQHVRPHPRPFPQGEGRKK